jgi:hypothetical protein
MTLEEFKEEINKLCMGCKKCDPCCTGNILKKCIDNNRLDFSVAGLTAFPE